MRCPHEVLRGVAAILLSGAASTALGVVFDSGTVNNVDSPLLGGAGNATVFDSATGETTTLNALAGAVINGITANDSSIVNVFEGSTISSEVTARDVSSVNILGGTLTTLDAENSAAVVITDGVFSVAAGGRYVGAFDNAVVTVTGGNFSAGGTTDAVQANGQSAISVHGGEFSGDIDANHDALITVLGGSGISGVTATEQAVIMLFGRDFTITSLGLVDLATPFVIGDDTYNGDSLSGTLADGSVISAEIFNGIGGSQIVLQAVPIPAAAWLLGSGLIGLVAFTRRRRDP